MVGVTIAACHVSQLFEQGHTVNYKVTQFS